MRSISVFIALAATAVTAQVQNYTSSLDMKLDPNSVSQQQRAVWCQAQTNTCQTLCDKNTDDNSCTQETLVYECTCASNSSAPALQYYTQTLPTFICQELFSQCIKQNVGSQKSQDACSTNIEKLCGTADPSKATKGGDDGDDGDDSASTTTASRPADATNTNTGAASSTSSDDFAAPTMAPVGVGAVAAAAAGLLAYLL